jgi:hypothetical protein
MITSLHELAKLNVSAAVENLRYFSSIQGISFLFSKLNKFHVIIRQINGIISYLFNNYIEMKASCGLIWVKHE